MELHLDKQALVIRLGLCVVVALALYQAGEKLCTVLGLPYWEQYRPWLEKNKVQALAVVTAVLFGLSLVVVPLERQGPSVLSSEAFIPCEPVEAYHAANETGEEAPRQ